MPNKRKLDTKVISKSPQKKVNKREGNSGAPERDSIIFLNRCTIERKAFTYESRMRGASNIRCGTLDGETLIVLM